MNIKSTEPFDIKAVVSAAVSAAMDEHLSVKLSSVEADFRLPPPTDRCTGIISVEGDFDVNIAVHLDRKLLQRLVSSTPAANIEEPGLDDETLRGIAANLIGNIAGRLESACAEFGLACGVAPPSVTCGTDAPAEAFPNDRRECLVLRFGEDLVYVEVNRQTSEALPSDFQPGAGRRRKEGPPKKASGPLEFDGNNKNEGSGDPPATTAGENEDRGSVFDDQGPKKNGIDSDGSADSRPTRPIEGLNLDLILDIPLELSVELGRTKMPIRDLLQLGPGSAVELSRLEGEAVDILANEKLIARGVVLVKDEKYGIKITEITGRLNRLRGLRR